MVYIDRRRYRRAYEAIVSDARSTALAAASSSSSSSAGSVSVLILVAPDVDALCACRILVKLLSLDHIGHNVVPVSGWADLARINREMVDGNAKLRNVVLLNLGSLVDLSEYFPLPEHCKLHVIDSHRPCNLDNLFSALPEAQQILVWDDGDLEEDLLEERNAFEALQYEPESDSEDEAEDSEDEDLRWRERQRRMLEDSEDEDGERSDGSSSSSRDKRRRVDEVGNEIMYNKPKRLPREKKLKFQNKIRKYYAAGTWHGQSIAGQLYVLASEVRREDNDLLWLAILGLTFQFITNLIDRERYEGYASVLANEVTRLNIAPQDQLRRLGQGQNPDDRSIRQSDEFRFTLFRHWNLYDAMYHSGYVASKMRLYRERGRKNLQGLLAKMGFSLEQCRQSYAHMDMDLKRSLRSKVDDIAPEYGLFDLSYPSFTRSYGYESVLSAGDVVECVSALLEVANGVRLDFGNEVGGSVWSGSKSWNSAVGKGNGDDDEEIEDDGYGTGEASSDRENNGNGAAGSRSEEAAAIAAAKAKKREEAWWVRNFWMAYDSLGHDTALLRSSLPLSMALHRAIIKQGIAILDKQTIKTLHTFRFCIIKEGSDLPIFNHPATLARLGSWLVDGIRDILDQSNSSTTGISKSKITPRGLPFVLAALDERRDSFLVVGISGTQEYGDVKKNKFGLAFQESARISHTRIRHDKFEASVVEVRRDDLAAFIQRINGHML